MEQGPEPGDYDAVRLLASMERQLDAHRRAKATGGMDSWSAYLAVYNADIEEDPEHGHLADLLLHWLTGGWSDAATLDKAHSVLETVDDPRRVAVVEVIQSLSRGDLTWEQFARRTKKGLIRREGWVPPPDPGPDAIPLQSTKRVLGELLADAGVSLKRLPPRTAWQVFVHFARLPVRAPRNHHVTDDRCLAELHSPRDSDRLNWTLVRQFCLSDNAGNYDHMRQLSLQLTYESLEHDEAATPQAIWSEGDLAPWARDVEALPSFATLMEAVPISATLQLSRI